MAKTEKGEKFVEKLKDNICVKLDNLENYEKKCKKSHEYIERCNELAEEYYDLMGEFYEVYNNFETVWGVQPMDEKYLRKQGFYKRVFKTQGVLFNQLYYGIRKNGFENPNEIVCMEYMLVPTGNIEIYKDPEFAKKKEKSKNNKIKIGEVDEDGPEE